MPWVFVLIWASGFIVARFAMPHAPPFKFVALRMALSAAAFGIWVAATRAPWPRSRSQWVHLAVVGLLMQAGYLGAVWSAVKAGIGAGTVSLIVGLQPVLTALWLTAASRRGGEAGVSGRQWLGLLLGLAGLVLVVERKLGVGEITAPNLGMAVAGLLFVTAGTLYQKRFVAPGDVRTGNAIQMIAAGLVALPLAGLESAPIEWHRELLGALAWSVLGSTVGGSSLLYLLLQRGAATAVTSLMYLVPPTTAVMAWLAFGEHLTALMLAGMALTAAGVALVVRAR
jgi:drug/metabolite transporter (DMT)-like permease